MGVTLLGNTAISLPFSSSRNLVKFHLITGDSTPMAFACAVRYLNKGLILSPTTSTLAAIGKVTPKFFLQNSLISELVPGSWDPKLFAGNPTITSLSLYVSYNFSRSAYCGVNPHLEAVFTIRSFFPLKDDKSMVPPSSAGT